MRVSVRASLPLSILLLVGCHHQPPASVAAPPPVPAPPPSAVAMQSARRAFALGDYTSAARDFDRYLQLVPSGGERDEALFDLGIIYVTPGQVRQDWTRAGEFLGKLVAEFPQSPLKPAAQVILSLRDQSTQLTTDISRLTNEAAQLRTEAAQLRGNSAQMTDQIAKLRSDAEQLTQEVEKREQRIRQLNTELERLIRIDSQPRPRP